VGPENGVGRQEAAPTRASDPFDANERLLGMVVANAPLILFSFDRTGTITMVEGRGLVEMGRTAGDTLGRSVDDVYRDDPHLLDCCHRALDGETVTATVRLRDRWFDAQYTPMRDSDGAVSGVIGISIDVTGRVRSEEALRESMERFQSSFELAAIGKGIVNIEGRWLQVNRALCEMIGYAEEEVLALSFQDITHPEDLLTDLEQLSALLAGTIRSYQMEKRYFHKRGHIVWVLLSVSLVHDAHGAPMYFISQIQDITARKVAEEAMRRHEYRLHSIIEMQDEIATADVDLDTVMKIIMRRTQAITGAEVAGIGLVDGDDLVYRAITDPAAVGVRVPIDASLSGLAIRTGEMMLSGNTDEDSRVDSASVNAIGLKSILTVPLTYGGETVGALAVSSPRFDAFDIQDVEALQLIAVQLGAAMSHAAQREAELSLARERASALEEMQKAQSILREQAELLHLAHDAIFVRHIDTAMIQFWNDGAERLYGFTSQEARGRVSNLLLQTVFPQPLAKIRATVINEGFWEGELLHTTRGGERIVVSSRWALQRNESGKPVAILEINNDITKRKQAEEHLEALLMERTATLEVVEHRSLHDGLTHLPNRTLIYNRLEHAIQMAGRDERKFALLFLDLDGFKQVNDTLGHRVGDLVLQKVASRVSGVLRTSDTVARLGGDEFAILLPSAGAEGARRAASKVLQAMEAPIAVADHRLALSASIGAALYPDHGESVDSLMQRADAAMYVAKRERCGFSL
jgi:diguanylate cyclase (GGDEF)-like protein/PAS domain S-box-containing protein